MNTERKLEKTEIDFELRKCLDDFNSSFKADRRFFQAEIKVNIVFCKALFKAGILNRVESERITNTLQTIKKRASYDNSYLENFPSKNIEDFVIGRLFQLVGDVGLKLKTGRSRAEQNATVFRLWLRKEIENISDNIANLQKTLVQKCFENKEVLIPGFSKMQNVHPILFAHWGLAYFEMFSRDRERLDEVWRRVNVLPLGAGKLAGTSYEIDYEEIARDLRFEGININSLDTVSDRDFAIEFVNSCSLIYLHLSRLASDLRFFSSKPNLFISFKDSKDSLPLSVEKINDALTKICSANGEFLGNQTDLFSRIHEFSASFNFEMVEIHKPVFNAADRLNEFVNIIDKILSKSLLDRKMANKAAANGFLNSDTILDYLINRGISFGTATNKVEQIISFSETKNKTLQELSLEELQNFSADFENDIFEDLSLKKTLENKKQIGGTSPERVFEALEKAKEVLERE